MYQLANLIRSGVMSDQGSPNSSGNGDGSENQGIESKGPARPTQALPSDRISFENQLNILRAYAAASGGSRDPVTIEEAAKLATVTAGTLTLNNGFFTETGLLAKTDDGFIPSDDVSDFHRAYSWDPDKAARKLAPTLRNSWFAQALLPHLTMKPMKEGEAIQRLGEECHAAPKYEKRLATLLDYLESADVVERENSTISEGPLARDGGSPAVTPSEQQDEPQPESPKPRERDAAVATMFAKPAGGAVQFHVDVRVDMAEMEDWRADRIAAFFNGIAKVLAAKQGIEEGESQP